MSILPNKAQVIEELEQFEKDYGDGDEYRDVVADYVLQVADEASGFNHNAIIGPMVAHPHDVLLAIYDSIMQMEGENIQAIAKDVFKTLDGRFAFITKED